MWAINEHGRPMKESVEIPGFLGMIGGADPRDLEPGMATYAQNINMVNQHGVLTGIPADTEGSAVAGMNSVISALFRDDVSGAPALALYGDGKVQYSTDFNTTTATTTPKDTRTGTLGVAIVPDGTAVHYGFGPSSSALYDPVWMGYIGRTQFGISYASAIETAPAELEVPPVYVSAGTLSDYGGDLLGGSTMDGTEVYLSPVTDRSTVPYKYDNNQNIFGWGDSGERVVYAYYISSIYDGYQEGPAKYITEFRPFKESCRLRVSYSSASLSHEEVTTIVGTYATVATGSSATASTSYNETEWKKITLGTDTSRVSTPATGVRGVKFTLFCRTATSVGDQVLNNRVTGFRIYRSEKRGGTETRLQFLKEIDATAGVSTASAGDNEWYSVGESGDVLSSTSLTNGTYWMYNFFDEDFTSPDTYEDLNDNVPADIGNMNVRWGLSATIDGYHIVGDCWLESVGGASTWLVRSKRHKFNVFDWTTDFLTLPSKPNALIPYNGRLYAFGDGVSYIVNVNALDVEDTFEGIGCISQQSATVTDQGLFWVDTNNIYHHDGTRVNVIGRAVIKNDFPDGSIAAWENVDFTETPITCYHPVHESFLVFYLSGSTYCGLMYHIPTRRWQSVSLSVTGGTINGLTGLYYTDEGIPVLTVTTTAPSVKNLFLFEHAANKRPWDVVGYQMRTANREKYFHAKVVYNGSPPTTFNFYEDDPDYSSAQAASVAETVGSSMKRYLINSNASPPWNDVHSFAFRMSGSVGTEDIRHISLIRKRLRQT